MRLRDIAELLRETLPLLSFGRSPTGGNWYVSNYRPVVGALRKLQAAGVLKEDTEAALSVAEIVDHVEPKITVSGDTFNNFNSAMERVRARAAVLLETLDEMLDEPRPEQIDIELPPDDHLADVGETFTNLEKVLHQVLVNPYVQGEVKLISFDRGSNWIELYLGSLAAISVVGAMVKLIYDMRVKQLDIAYRLEVLRGIQVDNDLSAAAEKALESEINAFREKGLAHIAEVGGIPSNEHDIRERLKFAVEAFGLLISRGLRVMPSLAAPDEQKAEFPDPKLIAAATRQLTEGAKRIGTSSPPSA